MAEKHQADFPTDGVNVIRWKQHVKPKTKSFKRKHTKFSFYQRKRFKQKLRRKPVRWMKLPVGSEDSTIYYWHKDTNKKFIPYRAAQKKNQFKSLGYTKKEYDKCCTSAHWTKAETDLLMRLCREYECRFVAIADRFNLERPEDTDYRTKENLKARFYEVQRNLAAKISSKKNLPFAIEFDELQESKRLSELQKLLSRTPAQHAKYTNLVNSRRKLEQNIRQKKKGFRNLQTKLKDCNKFIENRCKRNDITKSDLVLTMGGIFGYNAGYGTIIKDNLRKLPLPKFGILANFPREAVCRCRRQHSGKVLTAEQMMRATVTFTSKCGPKGQRCDISHPPSDDLEYTLGKNSVSYKCSMRVNKLVDDMLPIEKIKTPSFLVAHLYDKLRAETASLVALEQLIDEKEDEYKRLLHENDIMRL